jgi:hypothetical protein
VTPGPIVPAHELLGELLLDLGRPAEAHREFEATLRRSRIDSTRSPARRARPSSRATGRPTRTYYAALLTLGGGADTDRPELARAKQVIEQ